MTDGVFRLRPAASVSETASLPEIAAGDDDSGAICECTIVHIGERVDRDPVHVRRRVGHPDNYLCFAVIRC